MTMNRRQILRAALPLAAVPARTYASVIDGITNFLSKSTLRMAIVDTSYTIQSFAPATSAWPLIVGRAAPGDRVMLALAMGSVPKARELRMIRDISVPSFDLGRSQHQNDLDQARARENLKPGMAEAIAAPRSYQTELLRTFMEVGRFFSACPAMEHECTVISDMLNDDGVCKFETEKLTDKRIHEIIAAERRLGHLPELKGTRMRIVGATAATRAKEDEVRRFWIAYFEASNATVVDYGYNPAPRS